MAQRHKGKILTFKTKVVPWCLRGPNEKEGRLTSALLVFVLDDYFCFSSMASRVWVAEVTIGVPGPKILAAPAV